VGLTPDAEVGLLYSARSKWGLAFQAAFPRPGAAFVAGRDDVDERSYHRIFEAFYRGTFDAGVGARLIHDSQLVGPDSLGRTPAELAAELPVLIVPGLLVAGDELLAWLRAYAAAGGHLVIGPRTAYGDDEGRARTEVKPAHLADAAGVRYQEFSNLSQPVPVTRESDGFDLSTDAAAIDWSDGLVSEGSKIVLGYDHPHFGQFPAVVSTEHGDGRITTVGTVPNADLAADLLRWLVAASPSAWDELPASVTVRSATNRRGERIHVLHNWGWQPVSVGLPQPMRDVLNGEATTIREVHLGAWDVQVLAESTSATEI
jgi:beta-galactosidase